MPVPVTPPSGWGISGWGLSSWGLGTVSAMTIDSAYALSERSLRVTLSEPPVAESTIVTGDALNPRSWTVSNNDTGLSLLVLAVSQFSASVFDLYLLDKLGGSLTEHVVESSTLYAASGGVIAPDSSAAFYGCQKAVVTRSPIAMLDLVNVSRSETEIGGTLEVGSDGDYSVQGGTEFLRKLILRRLTTLPSEFFYLTSYGLGFSMKEQLPSTDLVRLKVQIEEQLAREPEFARVRVSLTLTADNMLLVTVNAVLRKTNESVIIPIPATNGLSL